MSIGAQRERRRSQPELWPASRFTRRRTERSHPQREETTARAGTKQRRPKSAGGLFAAVPKIAEPEEHPVLGALRDVQPDELSPKAAQEKLYQLKKLV